MKVLAINGSARKNGNTAAALDAVRKTLERSGIATESVDVGGQAVRGCAACGLCGKMRNRRCAFDDDMLNGVLDAMFEADGLLVGSPVHYAGIGGAVKAFLDRAFFVAMANGALFRHKVGAGVVAVRRGGEIAAWDQLYKYFTISEMFVPSGNYWNMVFGMAPGEAARDAEGMQCMEVLGENMAWLLRAVDNGRASLPPLRQKTFMHFIR